MSGTRDSEEINLIWWGREGTVLESGVSENIKCKVWWSGKRYIYQAVTVSKSAFFVDTLYFKWKIRKWAKSSEFQVRRKMLRKH